MEKLTVGLFNDSFPPTIDGVANVTVNYAKLINEKYGAAVVATPYYPDVTDDYSFNVVRYPSTYIGDSFGYRAGYPLDFKALHELEQSKLDIIHVHCPFTSAIMARIVRGLTGAPVIFTYHTKYNIDLENTFTSDSIRKVSTKFIVNNISACDEVWVVSKGAGENLRSLGYEGEYIVMENGVDFDRRRSKKECVNKLREYHGISGRMSVFLYVGRMMWYKGLRISLDGLKAAKDAGEKFRFVLVGVGGDRPEIEEYAAQLGLSEECIFAGAINDRELLRDYFSMANLFLFPSTFDTNGIVVREAAACSLPSVIIKGSCAAEGIIDGQTGILIDEDAGAMRDAVIYACRHKVEMRRIGRSASEKIYISWDDAVKKAYDRYLVVAEKFKQKHVGNSLKVNISVKKPAKKIRGE